MFKNKHISLFYAMLLAYIPVNIYAFNATWVASEQGYANGEEISSIVINEQLSVSLSKGSNSVSPKYYRSGNSLRIYGGNTITFYGPGITSIEFSFGSGGDSNTMNADVGEFNNGKWVGESDAVTFSVDGTSGHRRIAALTITYTNYGQSLLKNPDIYVDTDTYLTKKSVPVHISGKEGLSLYLKTSTNSETQDEFKQMSTNSVDLLITETTTIQAYSQDADGNQSDMSEAQVTIPDGILTGDGSLEYPLDVSSAIALSEAGLFPNKKVYIRGTVSLVDYLINSNNESENGTMTYYISNDGNQENRLKVVRGYGINGSQFYNLSDLKAGTDVVILYGELASQEGESVVIHSMIHSLNEPIEIPEVKSIAELTAMATPFKKEITLGYIRGLIEYKKDDLLYVSDNTGSILIIGVDYTIHKGDTILFGKPGLLYLDHGHPVFVPQIFSCAIVSRLNIITPTTVAISNLLSEKLKYSSMFVYMENVNILSEELTNGIVGISQDGSQCELYDRWNVIGNQTFDTEKKYNIKGIVQIYDDKIQILPLNYEGVTEVKIKRLKGDVNNDGSVDISDIVAAINQIAGSRVYENSDVNNDNHVDISDIVAIINIIAGKDMSNPDLTDPAVLAGLCPDSNHPHIINLDECGRWSCCNIGANAPWEIGGLYAWGETEEKTEYTLDNYIYRYSIDVLGSEIAGTDYDVVHVKWNNGWVMPSRDDFYWFSKYTKGELFTLNGVDGRKFTCTNGNSIFIPFTNYYTGQYWSSTKLSRGDVLSIGFTFNEEQGYDNNYGMYHGCPIRPIKK